MPARALGFSDDGRSFRLPDPRILPSASGYLFHRRMMLNATCRGYVTAQFMQPEPAKYAHAPMLAATTFLQPEQPYFAHHPGRFFYLRDDATGDLVSAPYEPVRAPFEGFAFTVSLDAIAWELEALGLRIFLQLTVPVDDIAELWTCRVENRSGRDRAVSLVTYFPVGYSSWMNMSAEVDHRLGGIVATRIAPYQKLEDHAKQKEFLDRTYLIADHPFDGWDANQSHFEGEGGLARPSALDEPLLSGLDARYEMPAACLQYRLELGPSERVERRFVFGPARDEMAIGRARRRYLDDDGAFARSRVAYRDYLNESPTACRIHSPDATFDAFVNHWLPRQVLYHGDAHRLTTDPQTRNYLQDAMGMAYLRPAATRRALLTALGQQKASGAMPDGILLRADATLKYINQIPHADHGVWVIICLTAYLSETGDRALLQELVPFEDGDPAPVHDHVALALEALLADRDDRGLCRIHQGDWCDPMNMVGPAGRGVSGWLSEALCWVLRLWVPECQALGDGARADRFEAAAGELAGAVERHLWTGEWYARGITDAGVVFGVPDDREGAIFLNAQSWALLAGMVPDERIRPLLTAVEERLLTPHGVALLDPPFTAMRDDVGRVTQKHPGTAENGSVYNHAAAFYAAALYELVGHHGGEDTAPVRQLTDAAFDVLRKMLPGPDDADLEQRGQLPVFIPNYYRGAHRLFPRTAGRSSQLFSTGTAAWFLRLVCERLAGIRADDDDLIVDPRPPTTWARFTATRRFRDHRVEVLVLRDRAFRERRCLVDGQQVPFRVPFARLKQRVVVRVEEPA